MLILGIILGLCLCTGGFGGRLLYVGGNDTSANADGAMASIIFGLLLTVVSVLVAVSVGAYFTFSAMQ